MDALELRKKYLEFFKTKGHAVIPGASLIPVNDPTVLFTTAGMHPLVPFLLGEKHPAGKRLANVQKCVRTGDIDAVGDSWHLTFFEMLGNWSLGDYWKKEAIEWSFEFLTKKEHLAIPPGKLSVTVFAGDKDAPKDKESAEIWQKVGIPEERIYYLPKEDNWWGPAGKTGPCGPCTEMFYDTGKPKCSENCRPGCACGKFAEIWNDDFMEYYKKIKNQKSKIKTTDQNSKIDEIEYEYVPLEQKNVDTGMGVERTVAVLNGCDNVYETELFKPIIEKIASLAGMSKPIDSFEQLYNPGAAMDKEIEGLKDKAEKMKILRIIADHIKAATFILAEGLEPSNVERGYVLRRLIRRAVRYGKQLEIKDIFTFKLAQSVIEIYRDIYPELLNRKGFIEEQLMKEEGKFGETLEKGLKQFEKKEKISGKDAFDLYQTYGFPLEMTLELAKEKRMAVDVKEFEEELKKHQEISRAGAEQKFKGGLADHSEQVVKYHTAAHLMLAALRQILGEHVVQKGSNITAERLRFDFSHPQKLTPEQIKTVEDLVNYQIEKDLPVKMEEMSLEEAKKQGAMGIFEARYGERVKVYSIGDFSKEICGGPHVQNTGILGKFKIAKEEASSAGVRRIKAVLE